MIAEIMDIPQKRVEVIIRNYAKTGRISSANTPSSSSSSPITTPSVTPAKPKITQAHIDMLRIWANEDAAQTCPQLTTKLNETFGTSISVAVVQRHLLDTFIFSLNRLSPSTEIKNNHRTLTLRKEFCQIYQDLGTMYEMDKEVIYIGHVRFRLACRQRVEGAKVPVRLRNLSVGVAMTSKEVIGYLAQNTPVDKEQFQTFVDSVIEEQRNRGVSAGVLIMDELCAGEGDASDRLSEFSATKEHTIIYLPPNSPFLNPLETLFSNFRELFTISGKEPPNNETQLIDMIFQGTDLIANMDCPKYVDGLSEYLSKGLEMQQIDIVNLHSICVEACEDETVVASDGGDGETTTGTYNVYFEED